MKQLTCLENSMECNEFMKIQTDRRTKGRTDGQTERVIVLIYTIS